jgi:hypothetical protein
MLPLDKPAESANELRAAAGQEIPFTVDLLEICAQTLSAVVIGSGPRALLHQNDVADRSRNRIPCVAVRSGLPRPVFDSASGRPAGQRTSSFQRCRQCARIDLRVCIRGCFLQNSPPGPISSRARRQRRSLHSNSACGACSSAAACAFGRGRHRRTGARTARRLTRTCVIRRRKNVVHRGMA